MVLNNVHGANICNKRGSLRQGNLPSMTFFGIGIDPLLNFLDKRPAGIPIASLSFLGPACKINQTLANAADCCSFQYPQECRLISVQATRQRKEQGSGENIHAGCRLH